MLAPPQRSDGRGVLASRSALTAIGIAKRPRRASGVGGKLSIGASATLGHRTSDKERAILRHASLRVGQDRRRAFRWPNRPAVVRRGIPDGTGRTATAVRLHCKFRASGAGFRLCGRGVDVCASRRCAGGQHRREQTAGDDGRQQTDSELDTAGQHGRYGSARRTAPNRSLTSGQHRVDARKFALAAAPPAHYDAAAGAAAPTGLPCASRT